jgi:enoyl-CoA hydratase
MDELNADPDVRAIIIRGVTADSFISGADISEFPSDRANAEQARAFRDAAGNATNALAHSPKPVVAMIAGICIGGGLQVALSCDMRIAARGALASEFRRHAWGGLSARGRALAQPDSGSGQRP